jgi:hypothetical protein
VASISNITYPPLAVDLQTGKCEWTWVPSGAHMTIMVGNSTLLGGSTWAADPQLFLAYEQWRAPGETSVGSMPLATWSGANTTSVASTVAVSESGWYRPFTATETGASTTTQAFDVVLLVGGSVPTLGSAGVGNWQAYSLGAPGANVYRLFPWSDPNEFATTPLPYYSTRTTAAAALFTNVTKIQNKEGTVMAARLSPAVTNVWNFTSADLVAVHPAEKQLLSLETGFYTFCPPSTDLANFWDYTLNTSGGAAKCPIVRLDNTSLVNAFVFSDPDGATSLAINVDYHLEFRTTSALWNIGLSSMMLEALHAAQLSLVEVGFFFPNETHSQLKTKVMPKLATALGHFASLAGVISPTAAKAMKVGQVILSRVNHTAVKPTSANASGWNGQAGKSRAAVSVAPKPKTKQGKSKKKGGK